MKSIVLFSFFTTVCCIAINLFNCVNATNTTEPKKLQVEIFYETLCPDSMRFVRNQLYTAIKTNEWLPYTDLNFIPYGKVQTWTEPFTNVTNLFCQHGNRECELNALHACIVEHNTVEQQLEMFNCLLKGYSSDVKVCSERLNIDISAANNCKNTRNTSDILKPYGEKTDAIEITFVPSISMNGTFESSKQRKILHNFSAAFCQKYKETFDVTLEKC